MTFSNLAILFIPNTIRDTYKKTRPYASSSIIIGMSLFMSLALKHFASIPFSSILLYLYGFSIITALLYCLTATARATAFYPKKLKRIKHITFTIALITYCITTALIPICRNEYLTMLSLAASLCIITIITLYFLLKIVLGYFIWHAVIKNVKLPSFIQFGTIPNLNENHEFVQLFKLVLVQHADTTFKGILHKTKYKLPKSYVEYLFKVSPLCAKILMQEYYQPILDNGDYKGAFSCALGKQLTDEEVFALRTVTFCD